MAIFGDLFLLISKGFIVCDIQGEIEDIIDEQSMNKHVKIES